MSTIDQKLRLIIKARAELDRLRARERDLLSAIAHAEHVVLKEMGDLPPGTVVPVTVPEIGRRARCWAGVQTVWHPTSWEEVYSSMIETGNMNILQRRLNSGEVAELHRNGAAPWAVPFHRPILHIRSQPLIPDET